MSDLQYYKKQKSQALYKNYLMQKYFLMTKY